MFGISDVAFPAAVVLVTQLMLDTEQQIEAAGYLSLCFSMVAYASPLSAMVRTKNPFPPKLYTRTNINPTTSTDLPFRGLCLDLCMRVVCTLFPFSIKLIDEID